MRNVTLVSVLFILSSSSFAGPSCNWKPIKTDTTKSNNYSIQLVTLDCNIDYYKNENITAQEAVILDADGNVVVSQIGNWGSDNEYYPDEVSIVTTPEGFPHQVILTTVYGASNISHTYHIYSASGVLTKIGKVTQPVNEYQTTNGKGSEREVVGFYESKGVFLIDRMTTEGTELGRCNACQDWNVETLALSGSSLVPVDLRAYSFSKYEPYEINR